MTYQVILPAAGMGKRMGVGKNKLFIELNGTPVFIHTLQVFHSDDHCERMIIAVHPDDIETMEQLIKNYGLDQKTYIVTGGSERQHSVYNALQRVAGEGIVLVHDAARPFLEVELLKELVHSARVYGAAVLAVPVKDTIKKVENGMVVETVERSSLWAIQTPQAFRIPLLIKAHQEAIKANFLGTDDASLIENIGEKVAIVEGDYNNIKLTTPEDLYFAQAIINNKRQI
jgi:2-C-methyl-D-erythritol 4-phosphate cytidylyltransferase